MIRRLDTITCKDCRAYHVALQLLVGWLRTDGKVRDVPRHIMQSVVEACTDRTVPKPKQVLPFVRREEHATCPVCRAKVHGKRGDKWRCFDCETEFY